jgi:rhamnogalacturonan endolyase
LMQDPQYRLSVAWQNVGYNQPPHTSFFMGHEMQQPSKPNAVEAKSQQSKVKK